ncbi:hypothetical protein [Harryflintia acetispora]|uniref:hypothetical protein n=1 Tax=Harryflintia acetispora TaxID=1849041 RepID=UPI001897BA74|nr:hypothetical protein [Harryflintia acetispora]
MKRGMVIMGAALALCTLAGFTVGGSGRREYYAGLLGEGIEVGSISAEMQLPADAGGPPHGGNHPPVATVGESEKIPLDDFTIGEISAASGDVVAQ